MRLNIIKILGVMMLLATFTFANIQSNNFSLVSSQVNESHTDLKLTNTTEFLLNLTKIDSLVPILGDPNANTTVIEFGDYQCEHCAEFNRFQKDFLVTNYTDSGEAKFTFKDFTVNDSTNENSSSLAAEASYCAAEQGKYWEYHDKLFRSNNESINKDLLINYANDVRVSNLNQFEECLDTKTYVNKVKENNDLSKQLNLFGTPTFVIYSTTYPEFIKILVGYQNHTKLEGQILTQGFSR